MTDLRHTNDVCFIQQQKSQQQQQFPEQQHKSLTVLRESFRTNCNSNSQTPERLQLSTKEQYHSQPQQSQQLQHMRVQQQNPLLQSLIDYTHSLATQQPTTVTAIGQQQQQQHYNGNTFGGIPPMDGIQFDEHEIYYVSPTKRKTSFRSQQQQQHQQQRFRISSPIRNTINCNQSVPTSTTTTTTTLDHASRLAGVVHDFSLDDTSSHYSDTAVQLLRSGSVSGSLGDTNNTSRLKNFTTTLTSNNNCRSHSSSSSSLATTVHFQNNHNHNPHHHHTNNNGMVKFSQQNPSQHYQGSLQRSKGRSSQSLCSCDAALDTEINLDSTRPLYQYDVEGKRTHTYSCEQNAQILMRLDRERKRKFSLGADVETATTTMTTTSRAKNDKTQKLEIFDMDFNNIPPVPPPPILKLHASKLGLQFLQHQQQQQKTIDDGTKNYNGRNGTLEALCTNDVGSLLDDCTASILKCANTISDELGFTASPSLTGKSLLANTTREKSSKSMLVQNHQLGSRPDSLSAFNKYLQISGHSSSHDDIIMPKSQKTDLSLCFLHAKGAGGGGGGTSSETRTSTSPNVEPYLHTGIDSRRNFNKYNTVGASSDYAKHWSTYRQQMLQREQLQQEQQEQSVNIGTNHCRCFSKSLSSFPMRTYFDTTQAEFSGLDGGINNQQILHSNAENQPQLASSAYPPIVTNSSTTKNNRFHVPTNVFNSSCNYKVAPKPPINALNEASFITLNDSTNSGLNHHHQHQHQHHHHSHQANVYQQNSPHPQRKQKHQHQHEHEHEHGQLNVQYSHHDYLLHNNKANILGLHNQSPLRNQQHHHNIHHSHHHHHHHQQQQLQLQQPLQEKHLAMPTNVTNLMPWKHRQCPSRCSSSSGTNSLRFDAAKHWLAVSSILLIIGAASVAVPLALRVAASAPFEERLRVAQQLLDQVPLIDGHNDLPWNIRKFLHNKLNDFNFDQDLRSVMPWARSHWSHTDLQRLKKGRVSAQFWAAYVPCEAQHRDAVQLTLEQIDVIKRLTDRYAPQLIACTSSEDIIEAHKKHQMCSLTGVEGGHSLGGSLAVLRTLYAIGVRYMTLTSTCHTPWADSSYADAPTFNVKHGGLTIFGKTIIREMNRLGMMVDLSHVSKGTMRDAMEVSEAPVIFSHSSAYELCNSSRNVQDDTLLSLAKNGGIVMVNFYSRFLSCNDNSTVHDAVAHINHIRRVAGVDHVGLGAGFDGINFTPKGLEDVSTYPTLFAELVGAGWTVEDLTKLAGGNFLRVMQRVEKIRDDKRTLGIKPYEDHPNFRTDDPLQLHFQLIELNFFHCS